MDAHIFVDYYAQNFEQQMQEAKIILIILTS